MVVDNEAGMEHISRGILPKVDTIILVSDCSRRGVQAVGRIAGLVKECGLNPKQIGLIVNRAPEGKLNDGTKEEIERQGLTLFGVVPQDQEVYEYDCDGKPMDRASGKCSSQERHCYKNTGLYQLIKHIPLREAVRGFIQRPVSHGGG